MPLPKDKYRDYDRSYREERRQGQRRKEPETLEAALEELRSLRTQVTKLQKQVSYLKNKEEVMKRQRQRRSGGLAMLAAQALKSLQKAEEKS